MPYDKEKMAKAFPGVDAEPGSGDDKAPETEEEAAKAFFEAGKAGKYTEAVDAFDRLLELCGVYGEK